MARSGIPDEIRNRAVETIAKAIRLGHNEAVVGLTDMHLAHSIPDSDLDELQKMIIDELEDAGYQVRWDDTSMMISF